MHGEKHVKLVIGILGMMCLNQTKAMCRNNINEVNTTNSMGSAKQKGE
jgi:hypothetical protein